MYRYTPALLGVALAAFTTGAFAQKPAVYPAKKQTARQEQQQALNAYCRSCAACMAGRG